MLRAVCSTPLSSSLLGPPGTSALPRLSRSPFTSTLPSSSASISTTQVRHCSWAGGDSICHVPSLLQVCLVLPHIPAVVDGEQAPEAGVWSSQQVFSLAGSTFSLPSSHIFGTPVGTVNPLLTQAENSHTGMLAPAPVPFASERT